MFVNNKTFFFSLRISVTGVFQRNGNGRPNACQRGPASSDRVSGHTERFSEIHPLAAEAGWLTLWLTDRPTGWLAGWLAE